MAAGDDAGPSHILSSAYNQPRIVQVYLDSTLKDVGFPMAAIQLLQSLPIPDLEEEGEEDSIRTVQNGFDQVLAVSMRQKEALQEAIRALSLSSTQKSEDIKHDQRLLLGYCKILDRKWVEAVADLDTLREHLHHHHMKTNSHRTDDLRRVYLCALHGLQIATALLGKKSDFAKYRRWAKQKQDTKTAIK